MIEIMAIGENLKALRKRAGLTQGELGEKAGIKTTQISRIENDDTDPKLSTIEKLITALNCSADDLLFNDETASLQRRLKQALRMVEGFCEQDQRTILDIIKTYDVSNRLNDLLYPPNHNEMDDWEIQEDGISRAERIQEERESQMEEAIREAEEAEEREQARIDQFSWENHNR